MRVCVAPARTNISCCSLHVSAQIAIFASEYRSASRFHQPSSGGSLTVLTFFEKASYVHRRVLDIEEIATLHLSIHAIDVSFEMDKPALLIRKIRAVRV